MANIKPIETVYKGYRFRSRTEARWAVFFETLGIGYQYEKEGFDLDGVKYLPDFYMPKRKAWIEIKGEKPTNEELIKAGRLCVASEKAVYVLIGEPWYDVEILSFSSLRPPKNVLWHVDTAIKNEDISIATVLIEKFPSFYWTPELDRINAFIKTTSELVRQHYKAMVDKIPVGKLKQVSSSYRRGEHWIQCKNCKGLTIGPDNTSYCVKCKKSEDNLYNRHSDGLALAYTAARQARFEFGEQGISRSQAAPPVTPSTPSPPPQVAPVSPSSQPVTIIKARTRVTLPATTPSGVTPTPSIAKFKPGQKVCHATFGNGVVLSSSLVQNDEAVTVAFEKIGQKRLLASFANLKLLP